MEFIDKTKKKEVNIVPVITPMTTEGITASAIKTETVKELAIVRNSKGNIAHHIKLKNVCDWNREGRSLIIREVNNLNSTILTFTTNEESILAEERFTKIMNGQILL